MAGEHEQVVSRRTWLQSSVVAVGTAVGVAGASPLMSLAAPRTHVISTAASAKVAEAPLRWAMCNEMYEGWTCERLFPYLARCGYDGVEIAPFTLTSDAYRFGAAERVRIRCIAERSKLVVSGLHCLLAKTDYPYYWTSPDVMLRQRTTSYLKELVRLCADLGGRFMVLGSPQQRSLLPGVSREEALTFAVESLQELVPILDHCDVTLAVEPLTPPDTDFLISAAETVQLIDRVASPKQVALHLDCRAMAVSEAEPICAIIRRYHTHLAYFHANDKNLQGPGFGEIDFVAIMEALLDVGYRGWVSVEPFVAPQGLATMTTGSIACLRRSLSAAQKRMARP